MAIDLSFIRNPWVLAAAGGGLGYWLGPKYIKKNGQFYGALGAAVGGYLIGRMVAPAPVATPTPLPAAAEPAPTDTEEAQAQAGFGEYVDLDEMFGDKATAPARTSVPRLPSPRAPKPQPAPQSPDVEDLSDLSEGWSGMGSYDSPWAEAGDSTDKN